MKRIQNVPGPVRSSPGSSFGVATIAEASYAARGQAFLLQLAPRINTLFNGAEVADLLDPALVILVDENEPEIRVVERIQVMARMRDFSVFETDPNQPQLSVIVVVAFKNGPSEIYGIPDPRVAPDWYKPGYLD
jgi:hypothetical protein